MVVCCDLLAPNVGCQALRANTATCTHSLIYLPLLKLHSSSSSFSPASSAQSTDPHRKLT
jgi:hypothetical protein